jgi:hypothetical protein
MVCLLTAARAFAGAVRVNALPCGRRCDGPRSRGGPIILDVHAHVGKPNYAYRASEFTRADLISRMKAGGVSKCCLFSFYDVQDNDYVLKSVQGGTS